MDARRVLVNAREFWYPTVLQHHRFMVAVSRVWVILNGRGGSAPDHPVWDQGSRIKQRRVDIRVNVDLAMLPSPPGFLTGPGFRFMVGAFLVRTLLPGLFVSVCCVRSLFSGVLRTWGTLVFLTWKFSFSLSNGLVTVCSARRLLNLMSVRIALLPFLVSLFQEEL